MIDSLWLTRTETRSFGVHDINVRIPIGSIGSRGDVGNPMSISGRGCSLLQLSHSNLTNLSKIEIQAVVPVSSTQWTLLRKMEEVALLGH